MSETENQNSEASQIAELREQCESLGQQVRTLLYGLVVASFTLTAFLGLSARRTGKELAVVQQQANQINEVSKREQPGIQNFLGQLVKFGSNHPEYQAILEKYNVHTVNAPPAGTTTSAH